MLLKPTARQEHALVRLLAVQCELYNAALEERRGAWRWEQRSVRRLEQYAQLNGLDLGLAPFGVTVSRGTLLRLDRAFQGFFRRVKAGQTPGFPRFRSRARFDAVEYPQACSWRLIEARTDRGRLYLQGIGQIRYACSKRGILGIPKTLVVRREGRRWRAFVAGEVSLDQPLAPTGRAVGLDLGVTNLAATSDGELIENERVTATNAARVAKAHAAVQRAQRGSMRRRNAVQHLGDVHRTVARQRRDALHKLSRRLIDEFDLIVLEDLQVANMLRRPRPVPLPEGGFGPNGAGAKSGLNKEIASASWATLRQMVSYKAENAGRTVLVIAPHFTSQTCHACGHVAAGNRVGEAFCCLSCGHESHADVNAARNILGAGLALQALAA
jgi:putative transposase